MTKLQKSKMGRIERSLAATLKRGLQIPAWTDEYYSFAAKVLAPTVRKMEREARGRSMGRTPWISWS